MDLFGWKRTKAVGINILLITVLSIPCILGFSVWSGFQPLGAGTNIMDLEDFIVSNNILPLGSVVYLLFCTHKNGWGWKNFIQEANSGDGLKFPAKVRFYMTHILPWVVVVIYLKGYYDMFRPQGTTIFVIWMLIALGCLGFIAYISSSRKKTEKIIKNWYRQVLFHTADTSTFLSFYLFSKRRSARIHIACTMIAA